MWKMLVAGVLAAGISSAAIAETQIIHAGKVITDPRKASLGPSTITVTDGRIVSIESGLKPAPAGVRLIDLSGKTVLPGLIDMHVHLTGDPGGDYRDEAVQTDEFATLVGAKNALLTVKAGFTTVRDLGAPVRGGFALRDAIAKGLVPGPRVIAAGTAISIVGGHGDVSGFRPEVNAALDGNNTCTGPEQCALRVRQFSKNGADVIKITATGGVLSQQARGLGQHFTDAEMKAIVDTAHNLGLRVAAHAHGARGIKGASRAGVDTIDHGTFADAAALKVMKEKGTAMVPTLMAINGIKERLGKGIYTPVVEAKVRQTISQMGKALNAAKVQGIPIAFGTDAGVFDHGRNAGEFALMVELGGMTPAEAITSATITAARLLDLETQIGRIAPGFSADIIAVDGDPMANVRALEKVGFVMVRGRVIP
jgi:imidazolonepropionase-like amidohydrolase